MNIIRTMLLLGMILTFLVVGILPSSAQKPDLDDELAKLAGEIQRLTKRRDGDETKGRHRSRPAPVSGYSRQVSSADARILV